MEQHVHTHQTMAEGESSPQEYTKFILVILSIIVTSWFLANRYGSPGLEDELRWFMGVFFAVFAGFKFAGYKMFALMFAGYDIVAKKFKSYAYAYPFIELVLAMLYLSNSVPGLRDWLTVLIMGIGSVGVAQEIRRRSGIHCACLGNIIKLPLSTVSLVEDIGMGLMAAVMLLAR